MPTTGASTSMRCCSASIPAESRVRRLAAETPAHYVAFDLLALDDDVLLDVPLSERRPRLDVDPARRTQRASHPRQHRPGRGGRVVRPIRGCRARRHRGQATGGSLPAGPAGARQGEASAHGRVRRGRLPDPQGRQRGRIAPARAVRRRRRAPARRGRRLVHGLVPTGAAGRAGAVHARRADRPPVARVAGVAGRERAAAASPAPPAGGTRARTCPGWRSAPSGWPR